MSSLASRLMPAVMTLRGSKRVFSSADAMKRKLARQAAGRAPNSRPPARLAKTVDIRELSIDGWTVYEITPKGKTPPRRALYLHGGCYVFEIALQHWLFVARLAVETDTRFLVPIYPLAPAETADTIVPKATALASSLIDEVGARNTSILGDSAGGGMALAVAMQLRDRGIEAPHSTVLVSPWLDITGTDPQLAVIAPHDPWLAVPGSHFAGGVYRGPLAETDARVSPIYGDLSGLGSLTMFSGTRDILNADATRFLSLAEAAGLSVDYHEVPGMIHVFPILPIPEGTAARAVVARSMVD
ncbi:alpha/beta hydrolase [Glaciihabitans sp. INWT7]|uniref:alpha/beta hydrolase fold domain-containing protein n=1 Tax=Glaciihabitans sp. INWT7 TaxID=2596912 RepID=UPI0016232312|nr:alpha/beta hydrolase [Glaciihabitans sp. INWT7]QNE46921.1 alpha/beta hydrolase [Glaciihabitans sp. INWT7]